MFQCWILQKVKITKINRKKNKNFINKDKLLSLWDNFLIEKISMSITLWVDPCNSPIRLSNKLYVPINRKLTKKIKKIIKSHTIKLDLNSKIIIKAIDTVEWTKVKENSITITLDIRIIYKILLTRNIIL